jgi:hypothetical protein
MRDPVVCADGHTYERAAVAQWLLKKDRSPMTGAPLAHKHVTPNHLLRSMIAEWVDKQKKQRQRKQKQQMQHEGEGEGEAKDK